MEFFRELIKFFGLLGIIFKEFFDIYGYSIIISSLLIIFFCVFFIKKINKFLYKRAHKEYIRIKKLKWRFRNLVSPGIDDIKVLIKRKWHGYQGYAYLRADYPLFMRYRGTFGPKFAYSKYKNKYRNFFKKLPVDMVRTTTFLWHRMRKRFLRWGLYFTVYMMLTGQISDFVQYYYPDFNYVFTSIFLIFFFMIVVSYRVIYLFIQKVISIKYFTFDNKWSNRFFLLIKARVNRNEKYVIRTYPNFLSGIFQFLQSSTINKLQKILITLYIVIVVSCTFSFLFTMLLSIPYIAEIKWEFLLLASQKARGTHDLIFYHFIFVAYHFTKYVAYWFVLYLFILYCSYSDIIWYSTYRVYPNISFDRRVTSVLSGTMFLFGCAMLYGGYGPYWHFCRNFHIIVTNPLQPDYNSFSFINI